MKRLIIILSSVFLIGCQGIPDTATPNPDGSVTLHYGDHIIIRSDSLQIIYFMETGVRDTLLNLKRR